MTNHIIINNTVPRIRYVSNGILANYAFPFAIFKNADLKVYFGSTLQEATTYTISGAGESTGGTVTLSQVPTTGTIITLTRELAIERTTDFQEGGALRADSLNNELDYQIACQQQIADNLNRSMVLPPYAADANVNLTLPLPSAGKAIVWNTAGTNLENSTIAINALESTINGYKTAAEAAATTATTKASEATTQAQTATTKATEASTQATIATTQAEIATQKAQEAASTLSSKANKNMDNLSEGGKKEITSLVMPDYTAGVSLNYTSDNINTFTAPYDCLVVLNTFKSAAGVGSAIFFKQAHDGDYYVRQDGTQNAARILSCQMFVSKNETVYPCVNGDTFVCAYYPLKGAHS